MPAVPYSARIPGQGWSGSEARAAPRWKQPVCEALLNALVRLLSVALHLETGAVPIVIGLRTVAMSSVERVAIAKHCDFLN